MLRSNGALVYPTTLRTIRWRVYIRSSALRNATQHKKHSQVSPTQHINMTGSQSSPDQPEYTSFPLFQDSPSPPATTEDSPTSSKPSPGQNASQSTTSIQRPNLEVPQGPTRDLSQLPQDTHEVQPSRESNQPHPQTPMTFTAQAQPEQKPHLRGGCDDECCDVCCCSYRRQGPAPQPLYHRLWYGAPTAGQK